LEPINVDFTGGSKDDGKSSVADIFIPPEHAGRKIAINLILTAIAAAVLYYFMIPALNFKAVELYLYAVFVVMIYLVLTILSTKVFIRPEYTPYVRKRAKIPAIIIGVIAVVGLVGYLCGATFFRAQSYSQLLTVEEGDFAEDVAEIDFSSVPRLDATSAKNIATRTLGELSDYVSQFVVSSYAAQINYKNTPVRVNALAYGDVFKWLKNTKEGIPAYIIVDMTTQEGQIVRLENGGMRYTPDEHFNRYLARHLRFQYPTLMFEAPNLEIDENGQPYWVVPVLDKTIGLFGGADVIGAAVVDAVTGETQLVATAKGNKLKTESCVTDPEWQWLDRVYSANILNAQYNYYGKLSGGFINSVIGQEGVKVTSDGYNYLALNDDVYMYTGVTSISSDQSIIGFVLLNQRTKETKYYSVSGALEQTAQTSAQGAVQQYAYKATFPLLLNISGEPTYFMALKDSSELVKMYAMVNVKQSTIVGTGYNLTECTENYAAELKRNGINLDIDVDGMGDEQQGGNAEAPETKEVSGTVAEIRSVVTGGETYFYIRLQEADAFYKVSVANAEKVVLLNVGSAATFTVAADADGAIIEVSAMK